MTRRHADTSDVELVVDPPAARRAVNQFGARHGTRQVVLSASAPSVGLDVSFAEWQSPDGQPHRVSVRIDGKANPPPAYEPTPYNRPCVVAAVEYGIGGLNRVVLVDALTESVLPVWATSVYVKAVTVPRRLRDLAANPILQQFISAALVQDDSSRANARFLDLLNVDVPVSGPIPAHATFDVPSCATGVRICGQGTDVATAYFFANDGSLLGLDQPIGVGVLPSTSWLPVPVNARSCAVTYGTTGPLFTPWIEWRLSGDTSET